MIAAGKGNNTCEVKSLLKSDIFGSFYYGKKLIQDDVLVVNDVGAYTLSFQSRFVRPLPTIKDV